MHSERVRSKQSGTSVRSHFGGKGGGDDSGGGGDGGEGGGGDGGGGDGGVEGGDGGVECGDSGGRYGDGGGKGDGGSGGMQSLLGFSTLISHIDESGYIFLSPHLQRHKLLKIFPSLL